MGMEKSLYDEMVTEKAEGADMAFDAGLDDMVFKPLVGPSPFPAMGSPGGHFVITDEPTAALQKRVEELERNMEAMVALVEELLNERERFETTHRLEGRKGSFASNFKAA